MVTDSKIKATTIHRSQFTAVNIMNKILQGLREYFDGVKLEFRRISWPKKEVLKQLIFFVLALTIMLALFAGIIDAIFSKIVQLFLSKF